MMIHNVPYILLADDTPDVLEMIAYGVKMRGWNCETATNPQEILDEVRKHTHTDKAGLEQTDFDLLITDVYYRNQEGLDLKRTGVQAIRELRREFFHNLPVIFITAWDVSMVRREALAVGQEVIAKPFDVDYVLDRAKIWMDWTSPRGYQGNDRRRYGINRSGKYRRQTDTRMIVPNEQPHLIEGKKTA